MPEPPDMNSADYVAEHWPHLVALADMLAALPETVTINAIPVADPRALTEVVHTELLRKQARNGTLGFT